MQFFNDLLAAYGWEGLTVVAVLLVMFGIQIYYYVFRYAKVAKYKNSHRQQVREENPPISVIVPIFSENYSFIEERLPLFVAQNYPEFEIVLVYVGQDADFYEDLLLLKEAAPRIVVTKLHLDPRYPISRKMALNLGVKSAYHECLIFSSVDAVPQSSRWLALMGKGFMRGDVVLGYCGLEAQKGCRNTFFRLQRMMDSADWLARAIRGKGYRGTLHNMGFTKTLYFSKRGFNELGMNIGEDDLFLREIMTKDNVSVVLSPRASVAEKVWGGWSWWLGMNRYFGSAKKFYHRAAKNFVEWEARSRALFFLVVLCALIFLPLELKIFAALILLLRLGIVLWSVKHLSERLGENKMVAAYPLYDFFGLFSSLWLRVILLQKDERVWR